MAEFFRQQSKRRLGRFNAVPSIDFDTEGMPDIPAFENSPYTVAPPQTSFDPSYNPFNTAAVLLPLILQHRPPIKKRRALDRMCENGLHLRVPLYVLP